MHPKGRAAPEAKGAPEGKPGSAIRADLDRLACAPPKEKVRALFPLAAGAVVLIALCLGYQALFQSGSPESRCEGAMLAEWRDSCWSSLARSASNLSYCDRIVRDSLRDSCLTSLALGSPPDEDYCNKIMDVLAREECYSALAERTGDPSPCRLIVTNLTLAQCYSSAAVTAGSVAPCLEIGSEVERDDCINSVYFDLAEKRNDAEYCRNVTYLEPRLRQSMEDACILNSATVNNNTAACAGIANSSIRSRCEGATLIGNCDLVTDPDSQGFCFYSTAIANGDAEGCARVDGESLRDNCYYQVAVVKMNSSICSRIAGSSVRSACRTATGGS